MDLRTLHAKLSRDKSYARAYQQLDGYPELVVHCLAVCEDRGLTQEELATQSGLKIIEVAGFAHYENADPEVVSSIVDCLEPWLRERGVQVERWMPVAPRRARVVRAVGEPGNPSTVRGLSRRPVVLPPGERHQVSNSEEA
jgi:hypothetical protein